MNAWDALLEPLRHLGPVDILLLAVLVFSVLVGLWRGFVFEVVSLLGWLVAFVMANALAPPLAQVMPFGEAASPLRVWAAYATVFVLVLVACMLLARLLRALISATPLSVLDRLLGGLFGAARGTLVLVIVATLIDLSPLAQAAWWKSSHGALWLGQALELLRPVLPPSLNDRLTT